MTVTGRSARGWLVVLAGGAVVASMAVAGSSPAAGDGPPVVTAAVQVTDNPVPVRAHSSPQVMRSPVSGDLVVVESDPRGTERTCNVHISSDEGRTWQPGGALMAEPFTDCSIHAEYGPYATGGFADDGTLYIAYVASDPRFADPLADRAADTTATSTAPQGCGGEDAGDVLAAAATGPGAVDVVAAGARPARPIVDGPQVADDCGSELRLASHPPRRTPRHVFVSRSTDGGRSFDVTAVFMGPDEPVVAPERQVQEGINKGPMVAVDPKDSDHVYVGWRQGDLREDAGKLRTLVAASTDGGRSFADPVDVSGDRGGDFPSMAVDGDGVLHVVYWERTFGVPDDENPLSAVFHRRSTDAGQTFSDHVEIDPGNQSTGRPPLIAAAPRSDDVYVVWDATPEPDNGGDGFEGDTDIFLLRSGDGGQTWNERTTVNDDGGDADQHLPGIAISPAGRVDVAWYDDRGQYEGFQDVFYAASFDQGGTFTPNVRINDRVIDRTVGVWDNNIGSRHNVGIASTDDDVHFAWQDTRNGDRTDQAEDVYAAQLDWTGTTAPVTGGGSPLVWAALGAAVTLAVVGGVLLVTRRTRHVDQP